MLENATWIMWRRRGEENVQGRSLTARQGHAIFYQERLPGTLEEFMNILAFIFLGRCVMALLHNISIEICLLVVKLS